MALTTYRTYNTEKLKQIDILLIEDDEIYQELFTHQLNDTAFGISKLHTSISLEHGLDAIAVNNINLILLDYFLPDSEEAEGLVRLRESYPQIPVIILTSMDSHEAGLEMVKKGAQDYLVKGNFSSLLLEKTLRYAIERQTLLQHKLEVENRILEATIEGIEGERSRIARELHDGLGQYLVSAIMNLEMAEEHMKTADPKNWTRYKKGITILKEVIDEGRQISNNLLPIALTDHGLSIAFDQLVQYSNVKNCTKFELYNTVKDSQLSKDQQGHLYRILQEGINNIVKHANASSAFIQMTPNKDKITLSIEDNGCGFDKDDRNLRNLGFRNIEARAKVMNGQLIIESTPNRGTLLMIDVPIIQQFNKK